MAHAGSGATSPAPERGSRATQARALEAIGTRSLQRKSLTATGDCQREAVPGSRFSGVTSSAGRYDDSSRVRSTGIHRRDCSRNEERRDDLILREQRIGGRPHQARRSATANLDSAETNRAIAETRPGRGRPPRATTSAAEARGPRAGEARTSAHRGAQLRLAEERDWPLQHCAGWSNTASSHEEDSRRQVDARAAGRPNSNASLRTQERLGGLNGTSNNKLATSYARTGQERAGQSEARKAERGRSTEGHRGRREGGRGRQRKAAAAKLRGRRREAAGRRGQEGQGRSRRQRTKSTTRRRAGRTSARRIEQKRAMTFAALAALQRLERGAFAKNDEEGARPCAPGATKPCPLCVRCPHTRAKPITDAPAKDATAPGSPASSRPQPQVRAGSWRKSKTSARRKPQEATHRPPATEEQRAGRQKACNAGAVTGGTRKAPALDPGSLWAKGPRKLGRSRPTPSRRTSATHNKQTNRSQDQATLRGTEMK